MHELSGLQQRAREAARGLSLLEPTVREPFPKTSMRTLE
jgi:hypothetical protein